MLNSILSVQYNLDATISATQVSPIDHVSLIQVPFLLDIFLSREVVGSSSADDGFITVVSKARKRRITMECKMIGIQMAIQVAKSAQSVKKLNPTPEPVNDYHLRPARKCC